MLFQAYVVGPLQTNCYLIGDEQSREVLMVDPGDSGPALLEKCAELDLKVTGVLATHHHTDHTAGLHEVLEGAPEATFYMSALDFPQVAEGAAQASAWYGRPVTPPREPDRFIEHGETIAIGRQRLTALHCPGHTPGSICLVGEGVAITGDVLFQGSIGRSDFPGGNALQLLESIHSQLLTLPDATEVHPGHGPSSSISAERSGNPFLRLPPEQMVRQLG